jgi:hypothetical protein
MLLGAWQAYARQIWPTWQPARFQTRLYLASHSAVLMGFSIPQNNQSEKFPRLFHTGDVVEVFNHGAAPFPLVGSSHLILASFRTRRKIEALFPWL